jgi:curved DNA-binding protein CbpA
MTNLYDILGLPEFSSIEDVKSRFRFLLNARNPEKFIDTEEKKNAEKEIKQIKEAYSIIGNPGKKGPYDQDLLRKKSGSLSYFEESVQDSSNEPNHRDTISKNKQDSESDADIKKIRNIYFSLGIILIAAVFYLSLNDSNNKTQIANSPTKTNTSTPRPTATVSLQLEKKGALNTAVTFSNYFENGNEASKKYLHPSSNNSAALLEIINQTIHDTKKWGKYLRVYDLEISDFSYPYAKVSGYIEIRGPYWLKYYFDIYLEKANNKWTVTSISMVKT